MPITNASGSTTAESLASSHATCGNASDTSPCAKTATFPAATTGTSSGTTSYTYISAEPTAMATIKACTITSFKPTIAAYTTSGATANSTTESTVLASA